MMVTYRVKLEPDDNGTLLVTCPALPEVTTFGEGEADAMKRTRDAIEEALAARMSEGRDIPDGDARGRHLVRASMPAVRKVRFYG
jgi:antitoxin HicB